VKLAIMLAFCVHQTPSNVTLGLGPGSRTTSALKSIFLRVCFEFYCFLDINRILYSNSFAKLVGIEGHLPPEHQD
jgi:hypothetical protein